MMASLGLLTEGEIECYLNSDYLKKFFLAYLSRESYGRNTARIRSANPHNLVSRIRKSSVWVSAVAWRSRIRVAA